MGRLKTAKTLYQKVKGNTFKCGGCSELIKTFNVRLEFQNHMRKATYKCYAAAILQENYSSVDFEHVETITYNQEQSRRFTEGEFKAVCEKAHADRLEQKAHTRLKKKKKVAAEKQGPVKKAKK